MSKVSPATIHTRYSENSCLESTLTRVCSKLKLKNLIIEKFFKPSLKKSKNCQRPAKDPKDQTDEIIDNLVLVEREYVKNLINSRWSRKRGGSDEVQKTPERKPCKKFRRKKSSIDGTKHVKRASSIRKYESTCSSPLSDKLSRILF